MDREILFRGKRLNNGEWVCGNLIQMDSGGSQSFIFPFHKYASSLSCAQIVSMSMIAVDSATVGQYTGLCDKNGVKIFEGDILRDGQGDDGVVTYLESVAQFCFMVGRNRWQLNEGDPNRPKHLQYTEVIGNIHDTPDLETKEEAKGARSLQKDRGRQRMTLNCRRRYKYTAQKIGLW